MEVYIAMSQLARTVQRGSLGRSAPVAPAAGLSIATPHREFWERVYLQ
jgi:hypothetical protein